ncbi:MAG: tRNA (adenine-N1)-methyltransferase [Methanomicrobia archaeon]|nr:tRNA (adenine-N1)-methyltransferase [Methanomicrobia archaeon]
MVNRVKEGELVHLLDRKGRRYTLSLKTGASFSFRHGTIVHDEIIGVEDGSVVKSNYGEKFLVFRPTLAEYIAKMRKGSQIIYPKDIAAILMLADIFPGATVLEAGIGSGALTMALLRAVGQTGKVISYERRKDFAEVAQSNIETFFDAVANAGRVGSGELVVKDKDVYEGIGEHDLDRIVLDLQEPWRALKHIDGSLRNGGILLCYNPTVLQIYKLAKRLELKYAESFRLIGIHELSMRGWEVKGRSIRPEHRMVAHTGFILVARKFTAAD